MSYVTLLRYKGIKIIYTNCSNIKTLEEVESAFGESSEIITKEPQKSVLAISNFENTFFNKSVIAIIKEALKKNKSYIKYTAVIGISGLAKLMFDGIVRATRRDLRLFGTLSEAKEFLYEKSKF